jgi:NitT/TauT family transport system substrate-binding protein
VRSQTRRTILWALALAVALSLVGLAYVRDDGTSGGEEVTSSSPGPGPTAPDATGEGCGREAATDPTDLRVERTVARCAAGSPAPRPLAQPASLRVAVAERTEATAPLLLADALGEFEAENLDVEVVELAQPDAFEAMIRGEVDVVVGGIDAPFFDAVAGGGGARLVLGGPVARAPGQTETAQTGLWARADLLPDSDDWDSVEGQTVALSGGMGSAAVYPIDTILRQEELTLNAVDLVATSSVEAARRLRDGDVGLAWLPQPAAATLAGDEAVTLVKTLPASESIDGTIFAPALVGAERATGLAYARAVVRTVNTHLADGYSDEARSALAEALGASEDEVEAGPPPLFDWELRAGTTGRIQESLVMVGGIGYERPLAESSLVDRSLYEEVVAAG